VSRKTPDIKRKRARVAKAEYDPSPILRFSPRFLLTFVSCSLSLFAFSIWLPESAFYWLNQNTAHTVAYLLNIFGTHPLLSGVTLSRNGFAVSVITECSTLYMAILFFSFVVAYPAALRHKLIGLPLGIAVLHAGNVLRIATIFSIGVTSRSSFEFVHVYLGQVLMVLFVLTVCLAWLNIQSDPSTRKHELFAFLVRFLAFTSIPFLLWLPLNREYVKFTDQVVMGLFSLFVHRFAMKYQHAFYYQTFNVVTFTGLILATRIKPLGRKLRMLAVGHVAIFALHILFRVCNVQIAYFHNEPAERIGAGITVCGQYILPVSLWLLMIRMKAAVQKVPFSRMGKRTRNSAETL
jgi:exosortase H (IPTLxxWG-CTERM-specific)